VADITNALQYAAAPGAPVDINAAIASAGDETPQTIDPSKAPSAEQSFTQGLGDAFVGLGRIAQHVVPEGAMNLLRRGLGQDPVSTQQFDNIVTQRNGQYQQARAMAGQNGIDWWRLAGNVANPVNYLGGGAGAAETVVGRVGQAALQGGVAGGMQAAAEPTDPGSFWWDTSKGASVGAGTGGILGSVIEGAMPAVRWGMSKARQLFGSGQAAVAAGAPDAVINQAVQAAGHDPATVNLNVLAGLKQDVQSALEHGADVSPTSVANRAVAESLPVPVNLTRGQATGDAMQFAREQNLRGVTGVGEPITNQLTGQNAAFIQNLDALGARNAPDPVSTGAKYADRIQSFWDALQARKDALYAGVRNSAGQSAAMDGIKAADSIKAALDTPQASHVYDALPPNIKKTIDSLGAGEFPLTVAQSQALDKIWGQAARGADGSTAYAINQARSLLMDAPIADDLGTEAKQAYMAARQAHAQQMSLLDPKQLNGMPNPNFQPMVKAVVQDGKPPEQLFATHFLNSAPSVAGKNLAFLSKLDPEAPQQIGQTLMGEIKRQALNSSSDARGAVSEATLRGWANDPVKSAKLDALLPKPAVDTFKNLASTVEAAKKFPVASAVNTSNTGSSVVNASVSMLKNSAVAQIAKRMPIAKGIAEGLAAAKNQTDVGAALNPGVTIKALMSSTPSQALRNRLMTGAAIPGAVATEQATQRPQD